MKNRAFIIIIISVVCAFLQSCKFTKPIGEEILLADPTIFVQDGKYYLTGTYSADALQFYVYESKDLKIWKNRKVLLSQGKNNYGEKGFWAPQIFKYDDEYFLTYTASEHTALAKSSKLTGIYVQDSIKPIDNSAKNIDSYIFKDDDGKCYLYHVRFNKGNYIWVGEFDMEKGSIKPGTLKQCLDNTQAWEATSNYKSNHVMEGPSVIKKDGIYYLFYSANHFRNIDYAVGYATAPTPYGPWTKNPLNPIIHRSIVGENGSGHGDFFQGIDNNMYYVYHVHYSDSTVQPRKTRIVKLKAKKGSDGIYSFSVDKESNIINPLFIN